MPRDAFLGRICKTRHRRRPQTAERCDVVVTSLRCEAKAFLERGQCRGHGPGPVAGRLGATPQGGETGGRVHVEPNGPRGGRVVVLEDVTGTPGLPAVWRVVPGMLEVSQIVDIDPADLGACRPGLE